MQYSGDYRRKCYIILPLIFLFIYFKLYSRTYDEKKKQLLSSTAGLTCADIIIDI